MKILFWVCLFFYSIILAATFAIASIAFGIYKAVRFVVNRLEIRP